MATALPDFVSEISGMLVTLLPVAALGAIVLAGLRLRGEGGINYDAGGSFFKWLFWGALLLTLPAIFSATIPAHSLAGRLPFLHPVLGWERLAPSRQASQLESRASSLISSSDASCP
jgi:hypothetical protein